MFLHKFLNSIELESFIPDCTPVRSFSGTELPVSASWWLTHDGPSSLSSTIENKFPSRRLHQPDSDSRDQSPHPLENEAQFERRILVNAII